jgi:hypothetical protein
MGMNWNFHEYESIDIPEENWDKPKQCYLNRNPNELVMTSNELTKFYSPMWRVLLILPGIAFLAHLISEMIMVKTVVIILILEGRLDLSFLLIRNILFGG